MAKRLTKLHIFYGWVILAASSIQYFIAGGRANSPGVFLKPISNEFGWSRVITAGASSLASIEGSILGILVGFLTDKYGARLIMWVGFAIGAAGFVVLGFIHSLSMFYFTYAILITLGLQAAHFPTQAVLANWFIRKRSRAFAILTSTFALGGVILTPGIGWLEVHYGWRVAVIVIGVVIGVVGLATTSFLWHRPEQYGYLPDGDSLGAAAKTLASPTPKAGKQAQLAEVDFTPGMAMRTSAFWFLSIGSILLHLGRGAVTLHAIPLLTDGGIGPQAAANFVGLSFFWGLFGRLMWGSLGDFVPKRYLLAIAVLTQAAGIIILANFTTTVHIYLYTIFFGMGQAVYPVEVAIRGEYFGRKRFATISGILNAIIAAGAFIGPIYAGWSYDVTGTYKTAFTLLAIACAAGAVFFFLARRPTLPKGVTVTTT